MIFGDPNTFAILVEKIPQWTMPGSYVNGMFHFIIDGNILPDEARVATLGGDLICLADDNALISPPEDIHLFNMPKEEAFRKMLFAMLPEAFDDIDLPDDFEDDYKYHASTYNLEDCCCYVFAVSSGDQIRILGAKIRYRTGNPIDGYQWNNVERLEVREACLPKKEVLEIVEAAKSALTILTGHGNDTAAPTVE